MNKNEINQLNPTEAITDSLPKIIEAFVSFYGEEERKRITTKFQNILVVGYSTPHNLSSIIQRFSNEKSEQIANVFLDKIVTNADEREKMKKILLDTYSFKNASIHPISKYISYLFQNEVSEYRKKEIVEFLNKIYPDVTIDNLDNFIKQGKFQDLNTLVPKYEEACAEYKEYEKKLQPYTSYVEKCKEIENKLKKKYSENFIDELKDLFTEEEYNTIKETFEDKYYYSIEKVNAKTKNYVGYSLNSPALIDAFSEESDLLLTEGSSWKANSIKQDRIKFFKNFGIDLGEVYEDYINNSDVQNLIPTKEVVNRVILTREKTYEKFMNEYCSSLPEFQKNQERIAELELLDNDTGYDANLYDRSGTCICSNLKEINGQYVEYPILYLGIGYSVDYLDASLIHEFNHIYELCVTNVKDNQYEMICGWDIVDGEIRGQKTEVVSLKKNEKRNYELFNEIINEMISQEISQNMSDMGIYIFNTPENKKIKGGTSYEITMFLVKDFYDTYKKEIIESRKNGNISTILDAVGKENFESMNDLFREYNENFNQFSIIKTYQDIEAGIENERTIKFKEIISKRDAILNDMNEYHQSKTVIV